MDATRGRHPVLLKVSTRVKWFHRKICKACLRFQETHPVFTHWKIEQVHASTPHFPVIF